MIQFTAYGTPIPKGSTKAFWRPGMKHAVVTHDNTKTKPWAETLKWAAIEALRRQGHEDILPMPDGPVRLEVTFYMPRPKSLPKKVLCHLKKPDVDKCLRNLLDSLTGIIWTDDSQVVEVKASKKYVGNGDMPRAEVCIERVREILSGDLNFKQGEVA